MRSTFIKTLIQLAEQDERIILLTADLGYTVLETFENQFPGRYYNVGVAEQNMIGLSTGLAEAGFIPFLYSIGTFASLRGYEFIRNGPILHRLPVRIIGVGGGMEYSSAGITHHSIDDVGVMRVQPGIRIIVPADATQTRSALEATWNLPDPVYYRIGKDEKISVPGLDGHFDINTPQLIGSGSDLLFVVMGAIAAEVANAASGLREQGIDSTIAIVSSLNPVPEMVSVLEKFPLVISVEDHYINGGIGSLVAEVITENGLNCRLKRCGIRSQPGGVTGSLNFLRSQHGLTASQLIQSAISLIQPEK